MLATMPSDRDESPNVEEITEDMIEGGIDAMTGFPAIDSLRGRAARLWGIGPGVISKHHPQHGPNTHRVATSMRAVGGAGPTEALEPFPYNRSDNRPLAR